MKKKMNKKGFTLVEIMIVVAIIGLLAAIGIPSILGAYSNAQEKAKARNVASVEKAKGVLTLPVDPYNPLDGAMALTDRTVDLGSGSYWTNMMSALRIDAKSDLDVGTNSITIGSLTTKATY
jgi:type IV pilus assembly protein PilA